MSAIVTLSADFQISIPEAVCSGQGWAAGQKFALIPKGHGVLIMPVPTLEQLIGSAPGAAAEGYRERE